MRIISGTYKGRRITPPANLSARPTTDFAKEGLFNLLNNQIDFEGIDVLDLFAGTGSIGVEFVSRGCNSVLSIEINDKQCTFIRKMCADLKIQNLTVLKTDVLRFVTNCHASFDMIFADPPYDLKQLSEIPDMVFQNNLLKADGLFVLEHAAKNKFENHPNFTFHRHYGNVNFSFFENK